MAKRTAKKSAPIDRARQRNAVDKYALDTSRVIRSGLGSLSVQRRVKGEFGVSGTLIIDGRLYREDYNPELNGPDAIPIYDEMFRSDGTTGAAADVIIQLIMSATFKAEYPKDATSKEKDIANALNEVLFEFGEWPAQEGWPFYLRHLLDRVPFGVGILEPIWIFDEDRGLLRWKRLAPRLPNTIDGFVTNADGTLQAVRQYAAQSGSGLQRYLLIPAEYAIVSTRNRRGDNYFGQSIYRRARKHYFYKNDLYRIDGVRFDRHGIGIPHAKLKDGATVRDEDLNELELALAAMRSSDQAWMITPPWVEELEILTPEGNGGATGLLDSVNHHDAQIVRSVLATFLTDHSEGMNTNRTKTLADVFLKALTGEAKNIAGDLLTQLVRPWCYANFDMSDARVPLVTVSGLDDMDPAEFSDYLQKMVTAKVITPTDEDEDMARAKVGMPPLPDGWKRGDEKPAAPAVSAPAAAGNVDDPGNPQNVPNPTPEQIAASSDPIVVVTRTSTPKRVRKVVRDPVTQRIDRVEEEDIAS